MTFDSPPAPVVEPAQPFYIPAPDWHAEEAERLEREREQQRQERERIVAEHLARQVEQAEQPEQLPAKRRRWRQDAQA